MNRHHLLLFALLALATSSILACTSAPTHTTRTNDPEENPLHTSQAQIISAFQLDIGDVIDLRVSGEPDLSGTYQIYPDCQITIPMIKTVKACGRTPNDLQQEIATRLHNEYFQQKPAVIVQVKEFNSKSIHVFGEVAKAGRFNYMKGITLLQVIALAGGFTSKAARNDTRLIRTIRGVRKIFRIPLGNLGKRQIPDLYIRPGDIVYIPESWL